MKNDQPKIGETTKLIFEGVVSLLALPRVLLNVLVPALTTFEMELLCAIVDHPDNPAKTELKHQIGLINYSQYVDFEKSSRLTVAYVRPGYARFPRKFAIPGRDDERRFCIVELVNEDTNATLRAELWIQNGLVGTVRSNFHLRRPDEFKKAKITNMTFCR
jgi:hypothetical protein